MAQHSFLNVEIFNVITIPTYRSSMLIMTLGNQKYLFTTFSCYPQSFVVSSIRQTSNDLADNFWIVDTFNREVATTFVNRDATPYYCGSDNYCRRHDN